MYIFILTFLIINFKNRGLLAALLLIGGLTISDQISSGFIKHTVKRLRPCRNPEVKDDVRLLIKCGPGYSFTSSHAANHFGFAFALGFLFLRRKKILLIASLWAFIISYSQVYVGVHYPFDILGGALVGIITGSLFGWIGFKKLKLIET